MILIASPIFGQRNHLGLDQGNEVQKIKGERLNEESIILVKKKEATGEKGLWQMLCYLQVL